jgi:endonuclease YncB( thermonuclease family)
VKPKPVNNYTFNVTVVRVVDGDTIVGNVDLGFHIAVEMPIRVYGINAPETSVHPAGEEATAFLAALLGWRPDAHPTVIVRTHAPANAVGLDKYGRWLGELYLLDGRDVAEVMIAAGHAVAYFG